MSRVPEFATVDPFDGMTAANPGILQNLVGGQWVNGDGGYYDLIDPMNGEVFVREPTTSDLTPYLDGLKSCPKSGMHNPIKNPDRYVYLGQVCARAAALLAQPDVDGGLIGGASLTSRAFCGIVQAAIEQAS